MIKTFQTGPGATGGRLYFAKAINVLSRQFAIESVPVFQGRRLNRLQQIWTIARERGRADIWLREDPAVCAWALPGTRSRQPGIQIGIIYHIDGSGQPHAQFSKILGHLCLQGLRGMDHVVVISRFWQDFLQRRGVKNVTTIYCPLDVDAFQSDPDGVLDFKRRYRLLDKPIVYLGPARGVKGIAQAAEALRTQPYCLVASGPLGMALPPFVVHLDLKTEDYRLLLQAAQVTVSMSTFLEGWNMVAHESLLSGTPVVGSGSGGLGELMEGSHQPCCRRFEELPALVAYAAAHRAELSERALPYVRQFTEARFASDWTHLLETFFGTASRTQSVRAGLAS